MTEMLPVVFALIGVIALMLAVLYLMKWINNRITGAQSRGGIKIITSMGVGQDKSIMAVKAGNKYLLLGVTPGGINLICELDDSDAEQLINGTAPDRSMAGKSFAECLKYNAGKLGRDFLKPYGSSKAEEGPSENSEDGIE